MQNFISNISNNNNRQCELKFNDVFCEFNLKITSSHLEILIYYDH
jgi:hypothetical protein